MDAEPTIQNEILARKRRKLLKVLRQWAAGGSITAKSPEEIEEEAQLETTCIRREAVVWFVPRRRDGASEVQRNMVQIRLGRKRERSKSVLYRAKVPATIGFVNGGNISRSGIEAGSLGDCNGHKAKAVDLESEHKQHGAWKFNAVRPMAAAKCQLGSDGEMRLGEGRREGSLPPQQEKRTCASEGPRRSEPNLGRSSFAVAS
jgi:hypothetical protein